MTINRRQFLSGVGLMAAGSVWAGDRKPAEADTAFDGVLRHAGIWEAAPEIGLDADKVFLPLAKRTDHPYRMYRWSVSYAETGGPLIQALPPEEEMGWMPWEEWLKLDGKPVRRAMALFPIDKMKGQIPLWWCLERSDDLTPRRATTPGTLAELFKRDRIIEAAKVTGFDAVKELLAPMSLKGEAVYRRMRWSVAPHRIAADLPVIQCLPPADKMREWPWETWYTDGKTPLIHHVHYTVPNARTEPKSWREREGAPQRPQELFGHNWYWYNDLEMAPALAKA